MGTLLDFPAPKHDKKNDTCPREMFEGAAEVPMQHGIALGLTQEGTYFFSSSTTDLAQIILMLELAKQALFAQYED